MSNTDLAAAARGIGAQKHWMGVRKDLAVQYAVTEHPELAGHEDEIRKGWTRGFNERRGR
jgi:hypothetical protein